MTDSPKVSFFKKGKVRPASTRQRSPPVRSSPSPPPPPTTALSIPVRSQTSEVVIPTRKATTRLLSQGTKRRRREEDNDEEEGGDGGEGAGGGGYRDRGRVNVNWASGSSSNVNAALEILEGDEAEALLARKRAKLDDEQEGEERVGDDGLYHGQAGYKSHITKSKEIPKAMRVGPQKSTNTIRTVTIVDYQPDVCKDYKETGFCGFGDTCKFLHDRGTYLAGWQLDKLAADPKSQEGEDASESDSEADIPFACLICRKPYTDPVVTRCGHYFCSACAIKRFAKTPKCLACGGPTGGIFNRADKVIDKLNAKRGRAEKEPGDEPEEGSEGGSLTLEGLEEGSE